MRLFAALDLTEAACEELAAWWVAASAFFPPELWRDIPAANWHLTLAFFGEVNADEANDLAEALAECAAQTPPLSLTFGGSGFFPRPSRPEVFWAGVREVGRGDGLPRLARCCRLAGRATVRKRSAKESPFRGHITLARGRGFPQAIEVEALSALPPLPDLSWQAERLLLYRSELHPDGARYRIFDEFLLAGTTAGEE